MTETTNIASALAAAQLNMGKALKQSNNPHFRSKYADLSSVVDACFSALNEQEISVIQPMEENELGRCVNTIFMHSSGEKVECKVPLILGKQDMQGLGSAITYARRYGLMSLAGIAPEDDDGNAASASADMSPPKKSWSQTVIETLPEDATAAEKARAVGDALIAQFKRKKTSTQLSSEWDKRTRELLALEKYPEIHTQVVDSYENQMNEFKEPVQ